MLFRSWDRTRRIDSRDKDRKTESTPGNEHRGAFICPFRAEFPCPLQPANRRSFPDIPARLVLVEGLNQLPGMSVFFMTR